MEEIRWRSTREEWRAAWRQAVDRDRSLEWTVVRAWIVCGLLTLLFHGLSSRLAPALEFPLALLLQGSLGFAALFLLGFVAIAWLPLPGRFRLTASGIGSDENFFLWEELEAWDLKPHPWLDDRELVQLSLFSGSSPGTAFTLPPEAPGRRVLEELAKRAPRRTLPSLPVRRPRVFADALYPLMTAFGLAVGWAFEALCRWPGGLIKYGLLVALLVAPPVSYFAALRRWSPEEEMPLTIALMMSVFSLLVALILAGILWVGRV